MAERTRNPRLWAVTAAAAASLTMLSACGVPDSGVPVVAGSPGPGVVNEQPDTPMALPGPDDANDSAQAVKLYFHAASSEWNGLHDQVGRFLTPRARSVMPETAPRISVVRVTNWGAPKVSAPDEHLIKVKGEVVGELSEHGILQATRRSFAHTFEVRYQQTAEGRVWLIAEPPAGYVISVDALAERFDVLPLYFVNQHSSASLVPDVRYVPKSIEWRKQRNLLVEWLLQGPASWLRGVALRGFPDGTKRRGNVYAERDERVVVSLSSEAEGHARPALMFAQLAWTLRPRMRGRLEVRVDERPIRYDGRLSQARDEFFSFNAIAARPPGEAYLVSSKGRVEAVPSRSGADDLPAVLEGAEVKGVDHNTAVDSAAATRAGDLVALVRWHGQKQALWVGRQANDKVAYQRVTGLPATDAMSEPVWAGGSKPRSLLVAVDGDLYGVDLATLEAGKVRMPKDLGPVRSISVAPDGYRLALVSGGRVHLGALSQLKTLQVTSSYQVTDALRGVVDVAWSRENHLVVAGVGASGGGLWEVSIDGVRLRQVDTPTGDVPAAVAGYPEVAMEVDRRGKVLIEQGGRVYEIYSSRFGNPGNAPSPPQGGGPFFSV